MFFWARFLRGGLYTLWLKRRTAMNIVIGGLAGSFAVLAGAAAVDPGLGPLPWLLALVLFLWTPPHFWSLAIANSADYAQAGVPMLPVVVGPPARRAHRAPAVPSPCSLPRWHPGLWRGMGVRRRGPRGRPALRAQVLAAGTQA